MPGDPTLWKQILCGLLLGLVGAVCLYRSATAPLPAAHVIQVGFNPKNALLLAFRIATFVFFLVVWILQIEQTNWFQLVYYTYWNFTLQTIYFGGAAVDQVRRWAQPTMVNLYDANRVLNAVFDVVFATVFLVALVFWIFIFKSDETITWSTYIVHLVNVVFLLVEFTFNEHLVQKTSLKYVVLWPAIFASVAWIGYATYTRGFWPYAIMSLENSFAPVIWLGIGVAHVVCFGLVLLLSRIKARWVAPAPPSNLLDRQASHHDLGTPRHGYDINTV